MTSVKRDEEREERIEMEIVVDAYDEEERRMGWYCYLEDKLNFPFKAIWVSETHISTSTGEEEVEGEEVEVVGMSSEDDCQEDMFVEILYKENGTEDTFSVPLYDIVPLEEADSNTRQAIGDWHYWVEQGYEW